MLQEIHARIAGIRTHGELHVLAQRLLVAARQSNGVRIAIRFRIGIRFRDGFVAIGVEALNEARGFLIQIGGGEIRAHLRVAAPMREPDIQLLFFEARAVAPAAVVRSDHDTADVGRVALVTQAELAAVILIRSAFEREAALPAFRRVERKSH